MKVTILFENHGGFKKGLWGGHGSSTLVEHKEYMLIPLVILLRNMNALGIRPADIDYLLLIHGHYDHTEGLKDLLKQGGKKSMIIAHPGVFVRVTLKPHLRPAV